MPASVTRKVLWRDDFGLCVLWPKTMWSDAPEPGGALTATVDGKRRRLRVASEQCSCRGGTPHEHRFLMLPRSTGLQPDRACVVRIG